MFHEDGYHGKDSKVLLSPLANDFSNLQDLGCITTDQPYCYILPQTITAIRKNIFACLFSVHNTISLSRHEQVCLMRLRFDDGRSISRNVASLNILVHDVINLLY